MTFRTETTDYGVTVVSAIQTGYNHELQVTISSNNLVIKVAMHPTPKVDQRTEISRADFAKVFNNATTFFSDFLKINPQ